MDNNYRPILRIKNQYLIKLGPSATLRAIKLSLRSNVYNRNNAIWPLVSLDCDSGTNLPWILFLKLSLASNMRPGPS